MDIQPNIDNQQMLPKGTVLHGTYRIERYLASGGFGNTYEAVHLKLKRKFAVKEFFLKNINERSDDSMTVTVSKSNTALYEQQRAKFEKEAQRIYDLSQDAANSHIVHVTDLFDENNTVYYVMDYIDGLSLSAKMKQQGRPFTEQEVVPFIEAVADALKTVHALSLQHLDIKPGNIMLDKQGHIYLIDFGASKQIGADGSFTTTTSMCYTKGYAPFEQVDQLIKSIGPWTDIYAVGATVYNLLTQQTPPLPTEINQEGEEAFAFPASVSQRMRRFILSCMQPKYKQRPQSVAEMLELLKEEQKVVEVPEEVTVLEVEKPKVAEPKQVEKPKSIDPRPIETFKAAEPQPIERPKPVEVIPPKPVDPQPIEMPIPQSVSFPKKKSNTLKIVVGALLGVALVVLAIVLFTGKHKDVGNDLACSVVGDPDGNIIVSVDNIDFKMVKVEGGTFWMGAQKTNSKGQNYDADAYDNESPVQKEAISTFYIGETEVTQELWQKVMGSLPDRIATSSHDIQGPKRPICHISWDECQTFIDRLNTQTGGKFRLPTEAEWEYAARGGNKSNQYKYSGNNSIDEVAWFTYNTYAGGSYDVKTKSPNELGLYDMSGNVSEWTSSYWRSNYDASEDQSRRVYRGGSWSSDARDSRVSCRDFDYSDNSYSGIGFRLALDPQ